MELKHNFDVFSSFILYIYFLNFIYLSLVIYIHYICILIFSSSNYYNRDVSCAYRGYDIIILILIYLYFSFLFVLALSCDIYLLYVY